MPRPTYFILSIEPPQVEPLIRTSDGSGQNSGVAGDEDSAVSDDHHSVRANSWFEWRAPSRAASLSNSAFRQILDQWFEAHSIRPRIVGEFQGTALLTTFGQTGTGIFAAPLAIEREVQKRYRVTKLGDLGDQITEYYAISPERKIKHPGATVIAEVAKHKLFGVRHRRVK